MLELRKMNFDDIKEQWEYVTSLPADENGAYIAGDDETHYLMRVKK